MSVEQTVTYLKTDLKKGLTSAEAEKRLAEHGPNELDAEEDKTLWERIAEQFEDVLVQILLASATISFIIAITGKFQTLSFGKLVAVGHESGQTRLWPRI